MSSIYPKQILKQPLQAKLNNAFLLMPFSSDFDEIYGKVHQALSEIGFDCRRADDLSLNQPIMTIIVSCIKTYHLIIADLTGRNANVFYETGIAHASRDAQDVILIAQSMDDVPFDLRHLPIVLYSKNNLSLLKANIKKRVIENKTGQEGRLEFARQYQSLSRNTAAFDRFMTEVESISDQFWHFIVTCMSEKRFEEDSLADISLQMRLLGDKAILWQKRGDQELFRLAAMVYLDLLIRLSHVKEFEVACRDVLIKISHPLIDGLDERERLSFAIYFAVASFDHPKFKTQALEWLLGYLGRSKIAGIDVNRSRVEDFFLHRNDAEIEEALLSYINTPNDALREAIADIAGERRLEAVVPRFISILEKEDNPYVARSVFAACGRMSALTAAKPIIKWVERNATEMIQKDRVFVIDFAKDALRCIDHVHNTKFLTHLDPYDVKSRWWTRHLSEVSTNSDIPSSS